MAVNWSFIHMNLQIDMYINIYLIEMWLYRVRQKNLTIFKLK